jgi:hypothetical protein
MKPDPYRNFLVRMICTCYPPPPYLQLRDSEFKQHADYSSLITRAKNAKGKDEEGHRTEFINLAESAKLLSKSGKETK